MADFINITEPRVKSVTFSPNPVKTNAQVTISVVVEEVIVKTLYPLPFAANEIASGEA